MTGALGALPLFVIVDVSANLSPTTRSTRPVSKWIASDVSADARAGPASPSVQTAVNAAAAAAAGPTNAWGGIAPPLPPAASSAGRRVSGARRQRSRRRPPDPRDSRRPASRSDLGRAPARDSGETRRPGWRGRARRRRTTLGSGPLAAATARTEREAGKG